MDKGTDRNIRNHGTLQKTVGSEANVNVCKLNYARILGVASLSASEERVQLVFSSKGSIDKELPIERG